MKVINIGVFADEPNLGSGFSVVCGKFAEYLSKYSDLRVIFFGRWGQERYFRKTSLKGNFPYEYVPCQGGTWDKDLVDAIVKRYKIDVLLTIDDWWSIDAFLHASKSHRIPFHFITPLDALPIPKEAYKKFRQVDALYIPNRSWKTIKMHEEKVAEGDKRKKVNVIYHPYGCDTKIFNPIPSLKNNDFTFIWIGRHEPRKNLRSAILAFEKMHKKYDVRLLIRTNWKIRSAIDMRIYIAKRRLPVIREQSVKCSHGEITKTYNRGHALLCTSKAGGFELQIIEAMACGIPALVTDWNFMNEHILHEQNGFRISYDNLRKQSHGGIWANIDVEELANYMRLCVKNQKAISKMGQWARKFVEEKYRWSDSAKALYESITSNLDSRNKKC